MQKIAPRKLKSFREVTKHVDVDRKIRRLAEALDLKASNPNVDLNYFTIAVPMRLSDQEKLERLSEMVDTVTAIQNSDVFLLAMWIPPTV